MRGGENDYSDTVYFYKRDVEGVPCVLIANSHPDAELQGLGKFITTTRVQNLDLDAEYKVSFDSVLNYGGAYQVWIYFCNANGDAIGDYLYMKTIQNVPSPAMKLIRHECNFTLKNSGINSNQNVFLAIEFVISKNYSQDIMIGGSAVTITNLDDNSEFFDGIWGTIKHIFYAIVGGTCDDGDYTTEGLFGKLKSGLDNLGARIGDFFSDFKQNWNAGIEAIKQKFKDISDAITNKLNEVKSGIVTVIENIKEDLKSLFIPSDDYFEGYKNKWMTFAEDHLGLVYQVTDITVTLVKQVQNIMLSDSYIFTFPAIKVPINGVTYTFLEEQQVNIDMWIKGSGGSAAPAGLLYDVYTVCVWALFVFALVKYATKVEGNIFGVGGDEE